MELLTSRQSLRSLLGNGMLLTHASRLRARWRLRGGRHDLLLLLLLLLLGMRLLTLLVLRGHPSVIHHVMMHSGARRRISLWRHHVRRSSMSHLHGVHALHSELITVHTRVMHTASWSIHHAWMVSTRSHRAHTRRHSSCHRHSRRHS
jgi:hypothetical protein